MASKLRAALAALAAAFAFALPGAPAVAQNMGPPASPITGTETVPCRQGGGWKACTVWAMNGVTQVISPLAPPYNCAGNGSADDDACLHSALAAAMAAGGTLDLGGGKQYRIKTALVISSPVHIVGRHTGWGSSAGSPNGDAASCIKLGVANLTGALTVTPGGSGSYLENFCIQPSAGVTNTAGSAVLLQALSNSNVPSSVTLQNIWIAQPCIGLDLNGNTVWVDRVYVSQVGGSGCHGTRIGANTTLASTQDIRITNSTVQGNQGSPPDTDMLVLDAGGLTLENNDMLYGTVGTKIAPGVNQQVIWLFGENTVLGDTTTNQGLLIDTADSTAQIKGLACNNCWAASATSGDEVTIRNTSAGLVTDIDFDTPRFYLSTSNTTGSIFTQGSNAFPSLVNNVRINGGQLCGYMSGNYGVQLLTNQGFLKLVNSTVSPTCAGQAGTGTTAINFYSNNGGVTVTNNDFTGNTALSNNNPTSGVVTNNYPQSGNMPSVSDASSIALTTNAETFAVTGTGTTILQITGYWAGRKVTLLTTSGAVSLGTGGGASGICTSATSGASGGSFVLWYSLSAGCWEVVSVH